MEFFSSGAQIPSLMLFSVPVIMPEPVKPVAVH